MEHGRSAARQLLHRVLSPFLSLPSGVRRVMVSGVFVLEVALATALAWLVRFDGLPPRGGVELAFSAFPVIASVYLVAYLAFGAHRGLWSYSGLHDFIKIPAVALAGGAGSFVLMRGLLGWTDYPRSIYVLTAVFLFVSMALARGGVRALRQQVARFGASRIPVLIVGAGQAGEMLVRDMLHGAEGSYRPVAFLDENASKHGATIHGVPVLGGYEALPSAVERYGVAEVIIAIPSATPAQLRGIVQACEVDGLPLKVVPSVHDILQGRVAVSSVRPLVLEDLLTRDPVPTGSTDLDALIRGRCVLVTGAGGSIGSELCRQIAAHGPSRLVMVERYENNLYEVAAAIADRYGAGGLDARACLSDVLNEERMRQIFDEHRPQLVFHAAACKHVPIVEDNPCEGAVNNVLGTYKLATWCRQWGVERMILISTDKAVNPANVMGATKRFAEDIVKALTAPGSTRFVTVRFGNVLGSNGSVVPRFQRQIERGGPVTVTHPEMTRYFMLISEAVHLVLEAARRGTGGEVFVLDMGEPVKILDLARNMIRLAGFTPHEDIEVVFTGLRPGERLFEELFDANERIELTDHAKLRKAASDVVWSEDGLRDAVRAVAAAAGAGRRQEVRELLHRYVQSYRAASVRQRQSPDAYDVEVEVGTVSDRAVSA